MRCFLARAKDSEVANAGSSGGFVRCFLAEAMKQRIVEGVVLTGVGRGPGLQPPRVDVFLDDSFLHDPSYSSVYAPSDPFPRLKSLPAETTFGVTLLPCQVLRLRRLQSQGLCTCVRLVVELTCNRVPETAWTSALLEKLGVSPQDMSRLLYRSGTWPGEVIATLRNGERRSMPYPAAWCSVPSPTGPCGRCTLMDTDQADVVASDPWGLNDITKGVGMTLCLARSAAAESLVSTMDDIIDVIDITAEDRARSIGVTARSKAARKGPSPMGGSICVCYYRPATGMHNFGESFIEIICSGLGLECSQRWAGPGVEDCWLIIGSEFHKGCVSGLLKHCKRVFVWGQGNGRGAAMALDINEEPYKSRVVVRAVRGPLTAEQSGIPMTVPQGDPGFLLPRYLPLTRNTPPGTGQIIYAPHWKNRGNVEVKLKALGADSWFNVFMKDGEVAARMQQLLDARFVMTNSLHVWIFCQAYRIPHALTLCEGDEWNMPGKWADVWRWLQAPGSLSPTSRYDEARRWWDTQGVHISPPARELARLAEAAPGVLNDDGICTGLGKSTS